jgi:MoxR-like ATPase
MARTAPIPKVRTVVSLDEIRAARVAVDRVTMARELELYVVDLVHATRSPAEAGLKELAPLVRFGASPRASIWLTLAARANAFLDGRDYVTPGDIKHVAPEVLRHRVAPTYEADAEGLTSDKLVARVLETVRVP